DDLPTLDDARALLAANLVSLPWEGLKLSHGDPAVPTRFASTEPIAAVAEGGVK
ncbi:nicotinate phosphoribosyltransferase, partial [Rhodococcus hoagii]|nr:nicotinate phosphoribosyltransferase [Prescottella equi]